MIDDNKKETEFESNKKSKYFKFQNWRFYAMIRSRRPIKLRQQLKEEQIDFLWEDIEKNLDEYKKAIALRDNEIAEAKKKKQKKLQGAKKKLRFSCRRKSTA